MQRPILKDRYWLQELLGEGAMGQVFRAVDARTGSVVAVKLLTTASAQKPSLMRGLAREVRAVARLHHPNVVQVVDYGQSDDDHRPFFVMEYVPGQSLAECRARVSARDLFELADGVLAALACAHARGVIHRDLKPENVIVVDTGDGTLRPKLVDFGVAQLGGLRATERRSSQAAPLSSLIVGTPAYMSPEQAQGLNRLVGPPSDLYALGVLLYELLAGRLPFEATTAMALIMAHVYREVPPLPRRTDVPDGLADLVERLLAKDPTARPQFAADVRRELRRLDWSTAGDAPLFVGHHDDHAEHTGQPAETAATVDAADGLVPTGAALFGSRPETARQPALAPTDELLRTVFDDARETDARVTVDDARAPGSGPLAPGLFGIREVPFVGRADERAELWSALERVLEAADTRVVIVHGPVGVGKSRLARWLSEQAEEEGLMQTLGLGIGPGSALPTDGLRGLAERYLRVRGVPTEDCAPLLRESLVAPGDFDPREVGTILGWLRPTGASDTLPATTSAVDPTAVCARLLRQATRRRPVLLLLDDLVGADGEPALDLVELLLATRQVAPLPALVIVTVDEDPRAPGHPGRLRELVGQDGVDVLTLTALPAADCRRLARAVLPVDDTLAALVATRSTGSPQFVFEILSHWLESDALVEGKDGLLSLVDASINVHALPGELVELVRSRLGTILASFEDPKRSRALLGRAALCGRRFSLTVLDQLLAREERSDLAPLVDGLVEKMVEEHFWIEIEAGVLQFARAEVHAMVAEHLVGRTEALVTHGHLAVVKRELYGEHLAGHEVEVAAHLLAAGRYEAGAEMLIRGGHQALAWARFAAARDAYERAEAVTRDHSLPDATRRGDEIDLGLARCALRTGDYDTTEARLDAIDDRVRSARREEALAGAALMRAELTFKRGHVDLAAELYEAARERHHQRGDRMGVAHCLVGMADVARVRVDIDVGRTAAVEARTIFSELGTGRDVARCLLLEGKIAGMAKDNALAQQRFETAAEVFEIAGDPQGVLDAQAALAGLAYMTDRLELACSLFETVVPRFAELGDRPNVAFCHRALGSIHRRLGNYDASERECQKGLELASVMGDQLSVGRFLNGLGELARLNGRWHEAIHFYERYIEAGENLGAPLSVAIGAANLGLVYTELQDWRQVAASFERAASRARDIDNQEFLSAFLVSLALAYVQLEFWDKASTTIDEALRIDARVRGTEPDLLATLTRFAEAARPAMPERARLAAERAAERWRMVGDEEAAEAASQIAARCKST